MVASMNPRFSLKTLTLVASMTLLITLTVGGTITPLASLAVIVWTILLCEFICRRWSVAIRSKLDSKSDSDRIALDSPDAQRLRAVDLVFLSDHLLPFGRSVPVMKAPRLSIFDLFLFNRASTLIVNSSPYIWPQQQVRILQILYFYPGGGLIRGRSSLRGSCGWDASWFGWVRLGPSSAQWAAGYGSEAHWPSSMMRLDILDTLPRLQCSVDKWHVWYTHRKTEDDLKTKLSFFFLIFKLI